MKCPTCGSTHWIKKDSNTAEYTECMQLFSIPCEHKYVEDITIGASIKVCSKCGDII